MSVARMEARVEKLELLVKDFPDIKKDVSGLTASVTLLVQQKKENQLSLQHLFYGKQ